MSLLGVDVGTSGCKAAVFTSGGRCLATAYREYDALHPEPGWAELDTPAVWRDVKAVIAEAAAAAVNDPVAAISVASLGEAVVPVGPRREVLGPSMLNFDDRGGEFLDELRAKITDEDLYRINGNPLGNQYSLTKLLWIQRHQPELYDKTRYFLHWGAFVCHMLGAEPVADYSLANRTLLFDVDQADWSPALLDLFGVDRGKLPDTAPSGTVIGQVSAEVAEELGLSGGVRIVTGAHDQCANMTGCGVVREGMAMYGMGTYFCIAPVFTQRRAPETMVPYGLNTEHHAAPGRYACFVYNQGGALMKWYRDTFAKEARENAKRQGRDVYDLLVAEIPETPSEVLALPHFAPTGPPEFVDDTSGVLAGLTLETERGAILRGLMESAVFYLRDALEPAMETGLRIDAFRAVGGGSRSDAWLQMTADILGRPLTRAAVPEAGALGGAILAGVATGVFNNVEEGCAAMVETERTFEPEPGQQARYDNRFAHYRKLWPLMRDYLKSLP